VQGSTDRRDRNVSFRFQVPPEEEDEEQDEEQDDVQFDGLVGQTQEDEEAIQPNIVLDINSNYDQNQIPGINLLPIAKVGQS
jgi:hypothetical protein